MLRNEQEYHYVTYIHLPFSSFEAILQLAVTVGMLLQDPHFHFAVAWVKRGLERERGVMYPAVVFHVHIRWVHHVRLFWNYLGTC